jgi:hypothetical protein
MEVGKRKYVNHSSEITNLFYKPKLFLTPAKLSEKRHFLTTLNAQKKMTIL